MAVVLSALLVVKIKQANTGAAADEENQTVHADQLQQVLELILRPLRVAGTHGYH